MIINIASKNTNKINALRELIKDYNFLSHAIINSLEVSSDVSKQPKSLEETVLGAVNRAKNVFDKCDLAIGIESGLMYVPYTRTDYMDVCVCVIYDGNHYYLGLSCAFEFPPEIIRRIFKEDIDADEAFYKSGLTKNKKIGSAEGAIGLLTKGRITRKDYTKQAIQMALIHLENSKLYKKK